MNKKLDQAIVLKRVNYSESDRILTLLTKEHGKISVFAKSVRSQKSRLSGGIELLCVSDISFIIGKTELKTLTGARLVSHFLNILKDMGKTAQAMEALKRINGLTEEGSGQEFFELLAVYLQYLDDEKYDQNLVSAWFSLQLLNRSGVLGEIKVTGGVDGKNYRFNYDLQGFESDEQGVLSQDDIKLVRLLVSSPKPVILQDLNPATTVRTLSESLFDHYLG